MKKLLLVFISMAFLVSVSHGQNFHFGLKGGLNIANQDYESDGIEISPDSRVAFYVGAFGTYMFSDQFGLQPELLYNQEGSKWDMFSEKTTVKMHYVSLPVLFRYQPVNYLNIHLGPQFSYRVKAESDDEDLKDETSDIEFAAALGAGAELPGGLGLSVRYILGLSDAFDVDELTVKNNVIQAGLTYRFGSR